MARTETSSTSALIKAADRIVAGIREGRYAPGQRLIEADLIEELEVSRSSVREALRRLEVQGLVEMVPHRGARVRRLTPEDVREIYETRGAIESGAARLAAMRIDKPGNKKKLKACLADLKKAAGQSDAVEYFDANIRLHEVIVELAENRQLRNLVEMMRLQTVNYTLHNYIRDPKSITEMIDRSLEQHQAVAERILAGDADGAALAMRTHLEATTEVAVDAVSGTANRPVIAI